MPESYSSLFFPSVSELIEHLTQFKEEHGEQAVCAILGYPKAQRAALWQSDPRAISGNPFPCYDALISLEFMDGYRICVIIAVSSAEKWWDFAAKLRHSGFRLNPEKCGVVRDSRDRSSWAGPPLQTLSEGVLVSEGRGEGLFRMSLDQLSAWLATGIPLGDLKEDGVEMVD